MSRIEVIPLGPPDGSEGHAFEVHVDGSPAVLLDAGKGRDEPVWLDEATAHDIVWVSHGHGDHAGALGPLLANKPRLDVVLPAKAVAPSVAIARAQGMDPSRAHAIFDNARGQKFHTAFQLGPFDAIAAPSGHGLGAGLLRLEFDEIAVGYTGDWALHPRAGAQPADLSVLRDLDLLVCEAALSGAARLDDWSSMDTISELFRFLDDDGPRLLAVSAFGEFDELAALLKNRGDLLVESGLASLAPGAASADLSTCRRHLSDGGFVIAHGPQLSANEPAGELVIPQISNPNARIALFNTVPKGTVASTLFGAKHRERRTIHGENRRVRARIRRFDFPSHATRPDLMRAVTKLAPKSVLLFHHGHRALESLRHALRESGFMGEIEIARAGTPHAVPR